MSILASVAIITLGALWLALPGDHALAWVSIGMGVAILAVASVQRAYLVRRLRHIWNQMEPMELTVREGGFIANAAGELAEVAWSRFVRFREAQNHFLLYKSADLYAIVPKRGFAGEADLAAFREMAAKGIGHT